MCLVTRLAAWKRKQKRTRIWGHKWRYLDKMQEKLMNAWHRAIKISWCDASSSNYGSCLFHDPHKEWREVHEYTHLPPFIHNWNTFWSLHILNSWILICFVVLFVAGVFVLSLINWLNILVQALVKSDFSSTKKHSLMQGITWPTSMRHWALLLKIQIFCSFSLTCA